MKPARTLRVVIEAFDEQGNGVVARDGYTVVVAGATPGDELELELAHLSPHRRVAWYEPRRVHARGQGFVEPPCRWAWPWRGRCGGCGLSHLAPAAQREVKSSAVQAAFASEDLTLAAQFLPTQSPSQYRNRSHFVVERGPGGGARLGSYAPRSHELSDMTGCRVLRPPLAAVHGQLTQLLAELRPAIHPEPEALRYLTLRASPEGDVLVDWVVTGPPQHFVPLATRILELDRVVGVLASVNQSTGNSLRVADSVLLAGQGTLIEPLGGMDLEMSASSFAQLNSTVAHAMYERVAELASGSATIWDLYCGLGGLGIAAARRSAGRAVVYGADSVAASIRLARANAERNGIAASYEVCHLGQSLPQGWPTPDTLLVNPPRRGLDDRVVDGLNRVNHGRLVYMSCNPRSFARDVRRLMDGGWRFSPVEAYDMLPETHHVELLAHAQRRLGTNRRPTR